MPASRHIVATPPNFDAATVAYLESLGHRVTVPDRDPANAESALSTDALVKLLADADGWIVGPAARVTRELLEALPRLQVIARRGVGYERVDVEAARQFGRVVAIAVGGNDAAVADHTIGLMLALGRRFRELQANMQRGDWTIHIGSDLNRKTVGIVGLGRIGRGVANRLRGFEARILATGSASSRAVEADSNVSYVALPTLLRESDYVTLHAPLNAATKFLINNETMGLMKPTAFIINTARGGLIEDAHLLKALEEGRVAGAGLDVFVSESDPAYKLVTERLLQLPNVIATPHAGGSTRESLERTNRIAAECVVAVLDGGSPPAERVVADGRTR